MNIETYEELCNEYGKEQFDKEYTKLVWADEVTITETSQQRAGGHRRDKVNEFAESILRDGQKAPGSVTHFSKGVKNEDGNTRLLALLQIQETTGERQKYWVSDYFEKQGLSADEWDIKRFNLNDHIPSSPNTQSNFEKLISKLKERKYFDRIIGFPYYGNENKYRARMLDIISNGPNGDTKDRIRHRLSQKNVEKVVDKVIKFDGHTPDYWSHDANSALKESADYLGWEFPKGTKKAGVESNGIRVWACGDSKAIAKDQLSYGIRSKCLSPNVKTVLLLYVKNIHGKGDLYIKKGREALLRVVEEWNTLKDIPGDPDFKIWDEVYFVPQIKSSEVSGKPIRTRLSPKTHWCSYTGKIVPEPRRFQDY